VADWASIQYIFVQLSHEWIGVMIGWLEEECMCENHMIMKKKGFVPFLYGIL
jgi:hypothetical protein